MELREFLADHFNDTAADFAMSEVERDADHKGYVVEKAEYVEYMPGIPFALTLRTQEGLVNSPELPYHNRLFSRGHEADGVYVQRESMLELRLFLREVLPAAVPEPEPEPPAASNALTVGEFERKFKDLFDIGPWRSPVFLIHPAVPRNRAYAIDSEQVHKDQADALAYAMSSLERDLLVGNGDKSPVATDEPSTAEIRFDHATVAPQVTNAELPPSEPLDKDIFQVEGVKPLDGGEAEMARQRLLDAILGINGYAPLGGIDLTVPYDPPTEGEAEDGAEFGTEEPNAEWNASKALADIKIIAGAMQQLLCAECKAANVQPLMLELDERFSALDFNLAEMQQIENK